MFKFRTNPVDYDAFTDPQIYPPSDHLCDLIARSHAGGVLPEKNIHPAYDSDDCFDVDPSTDITSDPFLLAELASANFARRAADALTATANAAAADVASVSEAPAISVNSENPTGASAVPPSVSTPEQ